MPLSERFFYGRKGLSLSPVSLKDLKMARTKKIATDQSVGIVAETAEQPAQAVSAASGSDVVYIACGLPLGLRFDDVDNGNGGTKTVTFPGVNHALRGKAKGLLLGAGNAVLVSIARSDWECIKRKHGRERVFTAMPPLLWEMKSEKEFKARRDEVAEMRSGVEPITPESVNVEPIKTLEA